MQPVRPVTATLSPPYWLMSLACPPAGDLIVCQMLQRIYCRVGYVKLQALCFTSGKTLSFPTPWASGPLHDHMRVGSSSWESWYRIFACTEDVGVGRSFPCPWSAFGPSICVSFVIAHWSKSSFFTGNADLLGVFHRWQ